MHSEAFTKERLIYTSSRASEDSSAMHWVNARECVGEDSSIISEYPSSAFLFRAIFATLSNIGKLTLDLIATKEEVNIGPKLEGFLRLNRALRTRGSEDAKEALKPLRKWVPIFPVIRKSNGKNYDELAPLNPEFPPWFIADRHQLRDSFIGRVPLLAFAPEELELIDELLKILDLDSRRLSRLVKSQASPWGKPKRSKAYTTSLRERVRFIIA